MKHFNCIIFTIFLLSAFFNSHATHHYENLNSKATGLDTKNTHRNGSVVSFGYPNHFQQSDLLREDSIALVKIYHDMGGKSWYFQENWLSGPLSTWENVVVENQRVVNLELTEVSGVFSEAVYALTALKHLVIFQAGSEEIPAMRGTVDERLIQLQELEYMEIGSPALVFDMIQHLGQMKKLKTIYMSGQQFTAPLPENISELMQLERLHLKATVWESSLPISITSLSQLESLALSGLKGSIPVEIGNLGKTLTSLILTDGTLEGNIPASVSQLTKLYELDLSANRLSGTVPAGLFSLPDLFSLDLSNNKLTELPDPVALQPTMGYVYLSNNLFSNIPELQGEANRISFHIDNNRLTGELPASWGNLIFASLNISHNDVSGTLPTLQIDEYMNISYNRITSLGNQDKLEWYHWIYARYNLLSFDDLIAYLDNFRGCDDCPEEYDFYSLVRPQDSVHLNLKFQPQKGEKISIDLGVDKNVENSTYYWFKDNQPIDTTTVNHLEISSIDDTHNGSYRCEIVNEHYGRFEEHTPALRLYYDGIKVELQQAVRQKQMITVDIPDYIVFTQKTFSIQTSNSSQLPLELEVKEGADKVKLNKDEFSILKAGQVSIRFYNDGNATYSPVDTLVTLEILKGQQQVFLTEVADQLRHPDETPVQLSYYATSGLPVEIEALTENIRIKDSVLYLQGTGQAKVKASQQGSENYEKAADVEISFMIEKSSQTITLPLITDKTFGDAPFRIEVKTNSGLTPELSIQGPARLEGDLLTLAGAGNVAIGVTLEGNEFYHPADTTFSFQVAKANQQISFYYKPLNDTTFLLNAESSAGLPVAFRINTGQAYISGDTLYVEEAGPVTVEAYQDGNENYMAADQVEVTVVANPITSIEDDMLQLVQVYPNPTIGKIWINRLSKDLYTLRLLDNRGVLLAEYNTQTEVDLTTYPAGVYLLEIFWQRKYSIQRVIKE